ncbi:hypothetical protein EJ08DRAFT_303908 [Tothia fuscella]|uniref:Uncharacterized protein n=1 Tax=Tothia fuscella TaxID=1048955 RepID=A0A9P4TX56_9PEZI|nr:hypothetical protein EJ08DRAFT_303908 [Tothia fuscella]
MDNSPITKLPRELRDKVYTVLLYSQALGAQTLNDDDLDTDSLPFQLPGYYLPFLVKETTTKWKNQQGGQNACKQYDSLQLGLPNIARASKQLFHECMSLYIGSKMCLDFEEPCFKVETGDERTFLSCLNALGGFVQRTQAALISDIHTLRIRSCHYPYNNMPTFQIDALQDRTVLSIRTMGSLSTGQTEVIQDGVTEWIQSRPGFRISGHDLLDIAAHLKVLEYRLGSNDRHFAWTMGSSEEGSEAAKVGQSFGNVVVRIAVPKAIDSPGAGESGVIHHVMWLQSVDTSEPVDREGR